MNKSSSKALISVIIPTRNRVNMLKQAVNSVLNQTHQNLELFIVDEASTDHTPEYMKSINDPRVHCIFHQEPKGGNVARNNGFKHAKGNYIAFLDDDDVWAKTKLEKQYLAFEKHPEVGLVSCNNLVVDADDNVQRLSKRGNNKLFDHDEALKKILIGNFIGGASFPLIRRKCFEDVDGFQDHLKSAQETNLYLRMIHAGYSVYICKDPLLLYREHSLHRITDSYEPKLKGLEQLYEYKKENLFPFINDEEASQVTHEHLRKLSIVYMQHRNYRKFIYVKNKIADEDLVKNATFYKLKTHILVARNRLSHSFPGRLLKSIVQSLKTRKLNKEWEHYMQSEFTHYELSYKKVS
ncbi:glycosyltransferase involved in cell wall biosynthesis [Geomicrobium halophilum]|uniref:Glycosyltransferase involved in cell wall biosynthesis n=1 Tax=Geomicrobium halophilum TaxID=549000 RepID=A0A841PTB7_9BACL|nr:glycosyltransferase involved in cell wall biosynthesis [Geomicrobium halophilum]